MAWRCRALTDVHKWREVSRRLSLVVMVCYYPLAGQFAGDGTLYYPLKAQFGCDGMLLSPGGSVCW